MLNFFRQKGLSSVIYGVIVVGMVLVFVLQFNPSAGKKLASVSQTCAAQVAGSCIEPKAHRAALRLVFPRGAGGMKQATASRFALEGLIERELLATEAERVGLKITDDEVTDYLFKGTILVSAPSDQFTVARSLGLEEGRRFADFTDPKTKQFELKAYERWVKLSTGRSPTEFREWQARELLAAKMRDAIRAPVRISESEVFEQFLKEKSTASVQYAVVRKSWIEKYGVSASPTDLETWKKDKINLGQVVVPVRHVLVKFPSDKQEDKDAAKAKAQDLLDRVKKGEDIAALAKEFSDDPGSKDKGGMYPGSMVEQFVEPFRNAVASVAPGELVPSLVETTFGYHVIKRDPATNADFVAAYKASKSLSLAKDFAQAMITRLLSNSEQGAQAVKNVSEAFRIALYPTQSGQAPAAADTAHKDGSASSSDAGAPTVKETSESDPERPQWVQSTYFNRTGEAIPAISQDASRAILAFAFEAKPGMIIPSPVRTDDGFLVVSLKDRVTASAEMFSKERDTFAQDLLSLKRAEALANYVKRLRDSAKAEIKVDERNVFGASADAGTSGDDDDSEGM